MEYKILEHTREGNKILKNVVTFKDNVAKQMQIEMRNGLIFMRMKSRKVEVLN